jgi:hypothetical protein
VKLYREGLWRSLSVCALVALCWWRLLAAAFDTWRYRAPFNPDFAQYPPELSQRSWPIASLFLGETPYLLVGTVAAAMFVNRRYGCFDTTLRVAVWTLALASFAVAAVGAAGLFDHGDTTATVIAFGPYPDTMQAVAGQQLLFGLGGLVGADLVARSMQRQVALARQPAFSSL